MKELGLVNGQLIDLAENVVPMEDRGHQFGDGVYEVTRIYNGRCFALNMHLERLYNSLRELKIPAIYTAEELVEFHNRLISESSILEGTVYLQITRGVAPRVHSFPKQVVPRLTMAIRPINSNNDALREKGSTAMFIADERWLRCDIKSLNLLSNILGKQRAKEAGCFEGVQVRDGYVTEGTSSNFFVVKDDVLWTHPTNNLILKGVTRSIIIDKIAKEIDIPVLEKPFTEKFVEDASEVFLTGTTTEVMPVIKMGSHLISNGEVGAISRKIQEKYTQLIDIACERN